MTRRPKCDLLLGRVHSHDCTIGTETLAALHRPAHIDGQRASTLRFGDPPVQALLAALLRFDLLPARFRNRELREAVAPRLRGMSLDDYNAGQTTYDLRRLRLRLRLRGLIERIPHSQRYRLTAEGLCIALAYHRTQTRVLGPVLSATLDGESGGMPSASTERALRDIMYAPTKADAERDIDAFVAEFAAKYPKAAACLAEDREALLAFFGFPAEHSLHLRTSNVIESVFAGASSPARDEGRGFAHQGAADGLQAGGDGAAAMAPAERGASAATGPGRRGLRKWRHPDGLADGDGSEGGRLITSRADPNRSRCAPRAGPPASLTPWCPAELDCRSVIWLWLDDFASITFGCEGANPREDSRESARTSGRPTIGPVRGRAHGQDGCERTNPNYRREAERVTYA